MIKAKKIIRIAICIILAYIIGFEIFYYFKNNGNVILFVSNQSSQIDSVDIKILVDGREIVSDVFTSGNFHNYKEYSLKLTPILLHEIEVISEKAQVKMVTQVRFYFVNWILLDLWNEDTNFENSSNDNLQGVSDTKYEHHWFTIDRRLFPIVLM
jgi:hypothetical protein